MTKYLKVMKPVPMLSLSLVSPEGKFLVCDLFSGSLRLSFLIWWISYPSRITITSIQAFLTVVATKFNIKNTIVQNINHKNYPEQLILWVILRLWYNLISVTFPSLKINLKSPKINTTGSAFFNFTQLPFVNCKLWTPYYNNVVIEITVLLKEYASRIMRHIPIFTLDWFCIFRSRKSS